MANRSQSARRSTRIRRRTGMLFQGGALFDSLTVWENVSFALLYRDGVGRAEAKKRAIENLAKVRLPASAADLRPAELSGGMQKRVALARAIIANARPDLLRRTHHRPRPDHRRRRQQSHRRAGEGAGRRRRHHHPRHGQRPQDRRRSRHAPRRPHHLARARRRRSTSPATPTSTSSSTAAPKGRSSRRFERAHAPRESLPLLPDTCDNPQPDTGNRAAPAATSRGMRWPSSSSTMS